MKKCVEIFINKPVYSFIQKTYNKFMRQGTKHLEATKNKIRITNKGTNKGENSKVWKGDKVKYSGLHRWIRRELGRPNYCENCGTTEANKYDWANTNDLYLRNLIDWVRLCRRCHILIDGRKRNK